MGLEVPFCDTPGQSAVVGLLAGVAGGVGGITLGLGAPSVAGIAAALAIGGELVGHLVRRDEQFRAAVRQVTDRR